MRFTNSDNAVMTVGANVSGLSMRKRHYKRTPAGGSVTALTQVGCGRVCCRFGSRLAGAVMAAADRAIVQVGDRPMVEGYDYRRPGGVVMT